MYKFIQEQIVLYDDEIEGVLRLMTAYKREGLIEKIPETGSSTEEVSLKKRNKNHPGFNTREYLKGILGTDVIEIYDISSTVALEVLGETGTDLSKWEREEKFMSWLNLCPNRKASSGKLINSKLLSKS